MTWPSCQVDIPAKKIIGRDISDPGNAVLQASFTSVGEKVLVDVATSCRIKDMERTPLNGMSCKYLISIKCLQS